MYLEGKGVKRDYVHAVRWFKVAADKENKDAQSILGLMYLNGLGVKRDITLARAWLGKAAALGDKQAASILNNLTERGVKEM